MGFCCERAKDIGCEQTEEKETGRGKREPVGMAKDFDFQMSVVYVMFRLTIWVASTTRTVNLNKYTQLRSCINTIFRKIKKSVRSLNI